MKVHNCTTNEEGGNPAYMDLVPGLSHHHRHTCLVPEGLRPGCPVQLPWSCGDSQPCGSGEWPTHPATRRGPTTASTEEGEPSLSPSRTTTIEEGEASTKGSTVPRGHDLLQHDIEEGVEVVGTSTTEPVAGHDNEKCSPRSAHGRGLG
jgi:hypothetical protein